MNTAYGYSRLSTQFQEKHNNTLEAQAEKIRNYFHYRLSDYAWGGIVEDPSASSCTPLLQRKYGKKLATLLKPGDAVILAKFDRGFRDPLDLLQTLKIWDAMEVSLHMLDFHVDTSTAFGKFALTNYAAACCLERTVIKERFQAGIAHAKENGWWPHPKAPYGYQIVKMKDSHGRQRQKLAPNPEQRRLGMLMWDMQHNGMNTAQIAEALAEERARDGGRITVNVVEKYLKQEQKFLANDQGL